MYTNFKRCYLCKMCILFCTLCTYIYIYVQRVPKKCIHILRDVIYVKCVNFFGHPLYICVQRVPKKVYTSEGAKKCIHILRDVIYVKCVYLFLGTLCMYVYIYICTEGAKIMYTHFKRCYLCKVCIPFFWHPLYTCIYVQRVPKKCIHIRGCQKLYTHFKRRYLCKMCILFWHPPCIYIYICTEGAKKCIHIRGCKKCVHILRDVIYVKCVYIFWHPLYTHTHTHTHTHIHTRMYLVHTRSCNSR